MEDGNHRGDEVKAVQGRQEGPAAEEDRGTVKGIEAEGGGAGGGRGVTGA